MCWSKWRASDSPKQYQATNIPILRRESRRAVSWHGLGESIALTHSLDLPLHLLHLKPGRGVMGKEMTEQISTEDERREKWEKSESEEDNNMEGERELREG